MRIAQEEIFGPIQTIQSFSTYEEGIELANDTRYGLSAGIGTERSSLIHNAAADLEAGLIYVNGYGPILPEAPYGGFKESGIGKDLGMEPIEQYLQDGLRQSRRADALSNHPHSILIAKYNVQLDTHEDNSMETAQKLHDTIVLNTKVLHRFRVADFPYQISNSSRYR